MVSERQLIKAPELISKVMMTMLGVQGSAVSRTLIGQNSAALKRHNS
jgi:hypothetical protein